MNLFIHELKSYLKPTLFWALSLCAITVLFLLMFPAFTKDVAASEKILANLPAALRDALGLSLKYFFTIYGFYAYILTFIMLAAAVQATNLGIGVVSKEISGKTADFLLTKPIGRFSILTSKLLAVVTLIAATNIILLLVSLLAALLISANEFSIKTFSLLVGTIFLVQIAFLALGVLLAVLIPKIKTVISVSLPVVFSFFIIGTLGAIIGSEGVRYMTAFKFYDATYIIIHGSYELKFITVEAVFVLFATAISYIVYSKKDIKAAS